VKKNITCPKCKHLNKTLRALPANFRCADLVCDFCGYLAQVKTINSKNVDSCPLKILGAAWGPQEERMKAGIYFPLFIVLVDVSHRQEAIYYLPADLQTLGMFEPRKELSATAKRAGWKGFIINIEKAMASPIRLL
jgi:type II restriction enzyme